MRPILMIVWPMVLALAGCQGSGIRFSEDSVFNNLFPTQQDNPAELARDPYDPDARYRGTVRLTVELLEPEDRILDIFRINLNDDDASVRAAAARGLAPHGVSADGALLAGALDDPEPIVRRAAALGLQRIHEPSATGRLLDLLDPENEPDQNVRVEAALALGQYSENAVVVGLLTSLRSDTEQSLGVHSAVVRSLELLTGQDFGLDFIAWQQWIDTNSDWFAQQQEYTYPVFQRSRAWFEYLPWLPLPPNEEPSTPVGLTRTPR
ncbi:MAG: HEAT repeat domain-containing protein [Phycisphaerales bacterium]|nr:HEAT repeat domain-containing protein [Phycisphaerales bacterium]